MKADRMICEPAIPFDPPVYQAYYVKEGPEAIDGDLSKPFWQAGEWIKDFSDLQGGAFPRPKKATRVKLLWNEEALYLAAYLDEDTIWVERTERDVPLFPENDFEFFAAPQDSTHRYYEIEVNAAGAVWDLYMEKPARDAVHRMTSWDIKGLECATRIDGRVNEPSPGNRGWSLEMKMPWFSLRECRPDEVVARHQVPDPGEIWRAEFMRVEHDLDFTGGKYVRRTDPQTGRPQTDMWVWAPTGAKDVHMPEMWGYLEFSKNGETYPLPADEAVKFALRRVYYREHRYAQQHGGFTEDLSRLFGDAERTSLAPFAIRVHVTPSLFEGIATFEGRDYHIREDGYAWADD